MSIPTPDFGTAFKTMIPPPPPGPTLFEQIVGVSVEDWMAADTLEAFTALLSERDRNEAGPPPEGGGP